MRSKAGPPLSSERREKIIIKKKNDAEYAPSPRTHTRNIVVAVVLRIMYIKHEVCVCVYTSITVRQTQAQVVVCRGTTHYAEKYDVYSGPHSF